MNILTKIGLGVWAASILIGEELLPNICEMQCYQNGEWGALTPPASSTTEGIRVGVIGDFLYMKVEEDDLEYAFETNTRTPIPLTNISTAPVTLSALRPKFQWDPGFRVGLLYRVPSDFWEFSAKWTHLNSSAKSSINPPFTGAANTGTVLPIWVDIQLAFNMDLAIQGSVKWQMDFDLLDIGFSRSYFLGERLAVEINVGGSGLWIDQKYDTLYQRPPPNLTLFWQMKAKNDFQGGGLYWGMHTDWYLAHWISIVGNFLNHIIYGHFDIKQNFGFTTNHLLDMDAKKHFHRTRLGLQGALGIRLESDFACRRMHASLTAMYEGSVWFLQNLLSSYTTVFDVNNERRGDLQMQGVSLSARIDF